MSDDEFRGRIEAGASMALTAGITLSSESFYDGIGSDDLDAYGGSLRLTVPLQEFGVWVSAPRGAFQHCIETAAGR